MANADASETSAAKSLRSYFGDRKPPDISRKITACVTCRRLKIKCNMTNGKPPCTRCKAQKLSCVVNKSLQTLLESDATWKETMEQRIAKLEHDLLEAIQTTANNPAAVRNDSYNSGIQRSNPQSQTKIVPDSLDTTLDLSCNLGAFPASSIARLSKANSPLNAPSWPDLISRKIISLKAAQEHLAYFQCHLDPFIHYAIGENTTIASLRAMSALLTTTICAVSSLCAGSDDYSKCLAELKNEVTRQLFADDYTFDDALALCIGALWLQSLSHSLQGLAVRIASQLDLHRCITKMPHTDFKCYTRTRLFFVVFLSDHNCTLICGKPPMTQEWRCLKHPATLLQSEFSTSNDLFLVCQVELWSLNRRVFETFGADVHDNAASRNRKEVDRLLDAYKAWYGNWRKALNFDQEAETQQHCIFELYYHSAKLCLLTHAFRGRPSGYTAVTGNAQSQAAFDSALAIVQTITASETACEWLNVMPWYFHTMLAFACVCLIRIAFHLREVTEDDTLRARTQLEQLAGTLRHMTASRQPISNIAECIELALVTENHCNAGLQTNGNDIEAPLNFDWDDFWNDSLPSNFLGDEAMWMAFVNDGTL